MNWRCSLAGGKPEDNVRADGQPLSGQRFSWFTSASETINIHTPEPECLPSRPELTSIVTDLVFAVNLNCGFAPVEMGNWAQEADSGNGRDERRWCP
jgi:hypothetical protein